MGFVDRYLELPRPDDELSSIAENLRALFNARGGYGAPRGSFGLGVPYAQADTRHAVRALLDDMLANVLRYEPRLSEISLTTGERDAGLWLNIQLTGQVRGVSRTFRLRFNQAYGEVTVDVVRG